MWETVKSVSTVISLIAFVVAVAAGVWKAKIAERERLIKAAPSKSRAALISKTLEFFDVDPARLTEEQQFKIAMEQINRRAERFRLLVIAFVVLGLVAAGIGVFAMVRYPNASGRPLPGPDPVAGLRVYPFSSVVLGKNGETVETLNGKANYFSEDIGNGVNLEMVDIPGGTFMMGTREEDISAFDLVGELQRYYPDDCAKVSGLCKQVVAKWPLRETPQHSVTVRSFFIGKFEITQQQWKEVARLPMVNMLIDEDPSVHKGKDLPVERVSWRAAVEFCERLSRKTNRRYRLPTEAEWEYACRANTQTQFPFGDNIQPGVANYRGWGQFGSGPRGLDRATTVPVGSLGYANRFGLYDMTGNVWEWCLDRWHDDYKGAPKDGSAWLEGGDREYRVVRGGSWWFIAYGCRSAFRNSREESDTSDDDAQGKPRGNHGFRVVLEK